MATSFMTSPVSHKAAKAMAAPRAGAVAGILFALLFGTSVILIRLSVPANSADASAWTTNTLNRTALALRLIPFACIFFLWFMGVIREGLTTPLDWAIGIPLGIGLNYLGILKMIDLLKDKNTPYIFPKRFIRS